MMTQPLAGAKSVVTENELDIRGLFRVLWAGKLWIAGIALGFALLALAYTFFAKQEWSATAITDRPTVNMLGGSIPSSSSCAIWISKPISPRQIRLPLWMKPIKSS
jgi:LPS O-antigen subunit length determinant protein (WzzB/FepE family)